MGVLVKNNAYSTLAVTINATATTVTLATGTGGRFPVVVNPDYFYATIIDTSNQLEVVKVTARSGDILTVVRAQDGTSARSYSSGSRIELRMNAALLEDIRDSFAPADGAVTEPKLAASAVTAGKIANGAVSGIKLETTTREALVPSGCLIPFAGTLEPPGWLLCAGQNVSRATYGVLFAVIGTTYGVGDGTTTFTLPDLRGRVVAGKDDMGGTSANRLTGTSGGVSGSVLGASGGAQTHTLTIAEMPSHNHTVIAAIVSGSVESGNGDNEPTNSTRTTNNTGGDQPHNNVQPTMILNYLIKT